MTRDAGLEPRLALLDTASPGAARLAELASLAVRVDAGLLRRMRQTFLPDVDVGAESDLWFSAIVESRSETGFQIAPSIAAELRRRLASLPERPPVARVRAILAEAHAGVSPAIRLEEAVNGIALELGDAGRPDIDAALRPALAALARGGDEGIDIARWAVLAAARLHPIVRQTRNARTLLLSASLLLRGRARLGTRPPPDDRIAALGWAIPAGTRSERIGVELVPGGLLFRQASNTRGFIDAPATEPVVVEVEWEAAAGPRRRLAEAAEGVLVPLDGEPREVTVTTLLGDQFRVTAAPAAGERTPRRGAFPAEALLAACVQVEPLGIAEPMGVAFAVAEDLLVGARAAVASYPIVGVHDDPRQLQVVEGASGDMLVALRPAANAPRGFRVTLPPGPPDEGSPRAATVGFIDGTPRWHDVVLAPLADAAATVREGTIFDVPDRSDQELAAAFVGAPLVAGQRAVGAVIGVTHRRAGGSLASIRVAPSTHLSDVVERARRDVRTDQSRAPAPEVYLSYADADREAAFRIKDALEEIGFIVWAPSQRSVGPEYKDEIRRPLQGSDFFVAILSRNAIGADEPRLRAEWTLADLKLSKQSPAARYVLPIVIDDLRPSAARVPSFLRGLRWWEASGGRVPPALVRDLFQLLRDAKKVPADEPPSTPTPRLVDPADVLVPEVLRRALRELLKGDGIRVLVVTGPPQSPLDEIAHAVDRSPAGFQHTVVEIPEGDVTFGPRELVQEIAAGAGLDPELMPGNEDVSSARATQDLARWLLYALAEPKVDRILTLRGFEHHPIHPEIFDLVSWLVAGVHRPSGVHGTSGLTRLIFVNYSRPFQATEERLISRLELAPVGRPDVVRYFSLLFESTGRPYTPAAVEQATESIFASLGSVAGGWDYRDLRNRLSDAARALTGTTL